MKRKNIVCIAMATTLSCTSVINSTSTIIHAEETSNNLSKVELEDFDDSISIMKKTEESEKSKENTGKQKSEIEQVAEKARDLIDQLEALKKETNNFEVLEGLSDTQFADTKLGDIVYDGYMKTYDREVSKKYILENVNEKNVDKLNKFIAKLEDTLKAGQIMLNHRLLNEISKKYPENAKIKDLLQKLEQAVKNTNLDGWILDGLLTRSKQKLDEAKKESKIEQDKIDKEKKKEQEQQKKKNKDKKDNKNTGNQDNKKIEDKQKIEKNNDIKKEEEKNKGTKQNDKNKINTKYIRIAGQDRIETSVQISKSKFKNSDTVIIASANNFPDALSASSLASLYKAPILLSNKDSISKSVIDEISRLGAKNIIVVGGENSISENALSSLNKLKVERISGNNRYETSKKISEKVIEKGYNKTLILVDGRNYPDALAASSLVAKNNGPILLVSDSNNEAKNNVEFAKSLNSSSTLIVGGINSVSKNIENELKNPTRISGSDRYETSKKVANAILSKNSDIYITTGKNYADAIASGPAVILDKAALILVDDNNYDIKDIKTKFTPSTINVIGGLNSISDRLLSKIK